MIKNLILLIFSAVTKTQPFSFVDIEELGKKNMMIFDFSRTPQSIEIYYRLSLRNLRIFATLF